jgi:hypothetical protein
MNEDNPPMALPNGHVYGKEALLAIAAQHAGVCESSNTAHARTHPRTQLAIAAQHACSLTQHSMLLCVREAEPLNPKP